MRRIARIYTDFDENFGIPRQSGLADLLKGEIVFEKEFRSEHVVRGLEEFSHIWLIWHFDHSPERQSRLSAGLQPTVRPPRLGGNVKKGVFATRSPFRPNPVGLSCVRLESVRFDRDRGPVLSVSGIDMRNGTEIYDIKPYLPHIDAHPEAKGGFSEAAAGYRLTVDFPDELLGKLPADRREAAVQMLSQDPRPGYQHSEERVYGVSFSGFDIRFRVRDLVLTVISLEVRERGRKTGGSGGEGIRD